jgi:hypothetical protein
MSLQSSLPTREAFLDREMRAWKALAATWCKLDEAALLHAGANDVWSFKDVMNHIAAWQEAALVQIAKLQRGEFASLGMSVERFNAAQHEADRDQSVTQSRRRLNASRRALLAVLERVDEKSLLNEFGRQSAGWWAKWTTYGHYEQHIDALAQFRVKIKADTATDFTDDTD